MFKMIVDSFPKSISRCNFPDWITHFKLECMKEYLTTTIGVLSMDDLAEVLDDESILKNIQQAFSASEYARFENAVRRTSRFDSTTLARNIEDLNIASTNAAAAKLEATIDKTKKIESLGVTLKKASEVDILFLLDCTGSMAPYIREMQLKIRSLVDAVSELYTNLPLRVAFVGYRDIGCIERISAINFSTDVNAFKRFVSSQRAYGGNPDGPEDVVGGLTSALEMAWKSTTRLLFHICDAPCHGVEYHNEYHDGKGDRYPSGDPSGVKPEQLLRQLKDMNVEYSFCAITDCTKIMINKFKTRVPNYVKELDLKNASSMMDLITKSISSTLSSSLSSSASTDAKVDMSSITIDKSEPQWSALPFENVTVFDMREFVTLDEVLSLNYPSPVLTNGSTRIVKIGRIPFAKGASRTASSVRLADDTTAVLKVFAKQRDITRTKYENSTILCHAVARFLSIQFNTLLRRHIPTIEYLKLSLVQLDGRPDKPFGTMEASLAETFEKYNSNHGLVVPSPTAINTDHTIVQAFSHWTYVFTEGSLLVCDCQGVFRPSANRFILTDPAIHCKADPTLFGGTNLGEDGVQRFFGSHKCNLYCKLLRLPSNVTRVTSA